MIDVLLWLAVPLNYIYWIYIHSDPANIQMVSNGSTRELSNPNRCT